jgi:uncharacterized membrane protein YqiK
VNIVGRSFARHAFVQALSAEAFVRAMARLRARAGRRRSRRRHHSPGRREGDRRRVPGVDYKHGELVQTGLRGVWSEPLPPGKYAFNTYAGKVFPVPTTLPVAREDPPVSGRSEEPRRRAACRQPP